MSRLPASHICVNRPPAPLSPRVGWAGKALVDVNKAAATAIIRMRLRIAPSFGLRSTGRCRTPRRRSRGDLRDQLLDDRAAERFEVLRHHHERTGAADDVLAV